MDLVEERFPKFRWVSIRFRRSFHDSFVCGYCGGRSVKETAPDGAGYTLTDLEIVWQRGLLLQISNQNSSKFQTTAGKCPQVAERDVFRICEVGSHIPLPRSIGSLVRNANLRQLQGRRRQSEADMLRKSLQETQHTDLATAKRPGGEMVTDQIPAHTKHLPHRRARPLRSSNHNPRAPELRHPPDRSANDQPAIHNQNHGLSHRRPGQIQIRDQGTGLYRVRRHPEGPLAGEQRRLEDLGPH